IEDVGQRDEIAEGDSANEQKYSGEEKACDRAALVLVQRRRNKKPDLIENDWRSQNDTYIDPEREDEIEDSRRMRVDQLGFQVSNGKCLQDRTRNEIDDVFGDVDAD